MNKPTIRRGWRTFVCDEEECGLVVQISTRDCFSGSGEICPECSQINFPDSYRVDETLEIDKMGNLLKEEIRYI